MGTYLKLLLGLWLACSAAPLAWGNPQSGSLSQAQADYEVGSRYYYGLGVKKDRDIALSWYMKSAEKGHAKAELAIAQTLSNGDLKNRRFQEALPWVIKAAGPHNTPQISGQEKAETDAKAFLRSMCKRGLVDFPNDHPFAKDPMCWLKRGNRLFQGSSKLDYYLRKNKKRYYGVKQDYVLARDYLERAFEAGEMKAAINLAYIYRKGLGVPKDMERFGYYTKIAGQEGHGESNYYLAERALEAGDHRDYIERLQAAAQANTWKASSDLAWAFYKGEYVAQDYETAFMYFFLRGQLQFVRARDPKHGDSRLPFFENKFLPAFQTEISLETLDASYDKALQFAKDNKFRKYSLKKIERSYKNAVSDFNYVQETGGEWHQSDIFTGLFGRILMLILFVAMMLSIRSLAVKWANK